MFLQLGSWRFDVRERAVVVGVLNRTRDSFFDRGAYYDPDRLLARAEQLVADGADVLGVGARPGGVGVVDVPTGAGTGPGRGDPRAAAVPLRRPSGRGHHPGHSRRAAFAEG